MFCQIGGQCYVVGDDQIARGAVSAVVAFAFQPDFRAVLRSGFYFQFQAAAACGLYDDVASEYCREHVDGDVGVHLAGGSRLRAAGCTRFGTAPEQVLEEAREASAAETAEVEAFERRVAARR